MKLGWAVCLLPLLMGNVWAQESQDSDYLKDIEQNRKKEMKVAGEGDLGWFFYYPDELKEKETEEKVTPTPPAPAAPSKSKPVAPMSVEWFAKNYEVIRNRAVDNPSPTNLRAELYAQRVMMDKSEVFTRKRLQVQQSDPNLQEGDRLPLFGATSLAMMYHQKDLKDQALKEMYSSSGLMVFYDENCKYCRQSITLINHLSMRFKGLDIRVYAKNTAKPDVVQGLLPTIKVYPDDLLKISDDLGITNWPSYVLVTPDESFSLISKGLVSQQTLDDRVLIAGFEHGILGKEWYDKIHHTQIGLLASDSYDNLPENMEEDPVLLINTVIDMMNKSSQQSFYDDFYPPKQTNQ